MKYRYSVCWGKFENGKLDWHCEMFNDREEAMQFSKEHEGRLYKEESLTN